MNEPSPVIQIIDEEHMALFFYREHGIVHHEIRTRLPDGEFARLLETGLEQLTKNQGSKWLSDDRGQHHLSSEENDWADSGWAPRAIRAGFKYWAVVPPIKGLAKIQMQRFIEEYAARGVTVKLFDKAVAALEWLKAQ